MQLTEKFMLIMHIIAGYIALTSGATAMIAAKGKKAHRFSGKIFFYSMLGVTITAVLLSLLKEVAFLFFIGIFVFQQNYNGWRSVKDKSCRPRWYDWPVLVLAIINGLLMVFTGNLLLVIFGSISLLVSFQHIRLFHSVLTGKTLPPLSWLRRHIGSMVGAYTGTITAFLVVNIQGVNPSWIIWLTPTIILIPLMRYWTWKYARKGAKKLAT